MQTAAELASGTLTLFVILDPIGVLPFFVLMTRSGSDEEVRKISRKAVLIAAGLLLVFAFLGDLILSFLGSISQISRLREGRSYYFLL
jgi:multiple antibiotic resistance protein